METWILTVLAVFVMVVLLLMGTAMIAMLWLLWKDEVTCSTCNSLTRKKQESELSRLQEGQFTEQEFQNLCHAFAEDDAVRFAEGCREYNRKLFGDKSQL